MWVGVWCPKRRFSTRFFPEPSHYVSVLCLALCNTLWFLSGRGRTSREQRLKKIGAFWPDDLAPTTLETTRRRPLLQVFEKGRLPALASPL